MQKQKNYYTKKFFILSINQNHNMITSVEQMKSIFKKNKKCFRNIYALLGAKFKITTYMYKAWLQPLHQVWYWSSEGVKRYWADNTLGSREWFDLDLWTCDLKINREHLLIEVNPCTKFGIDQVKGSNDIERTTLGLQTDRPTYRTTVAKHYAPFFKGGIKKSSNN